MRAVVQRVRRAEVRVDGQTRARISRGLLVYLAVAGQDGREDVSYVANKVLGLRVFPDADGKLNLSIRQTSGQILLVSAFTVLGDARKGRRPSFAAAAAPEHAEQLYHAVGDRLADSGLRVQRGVFAAHMCVEAVNDGPVCILLDSGRVL